MTTFSLCALGIALGAVLTVSAKLDRSPAGPALMAAASAVCLLLVGVARGWGLADGLTLVASAPVGVWLGAGLVREHLQSRG